jgi:hypothetical protein
MKIYGLSCFWTRLLYEVIIERWIESMSLNQHLVVLWAGVASSGLRSIDSAHTVLC